MLSERKNRYQVSHCIVQCKPSKILPNNRRDKRLESLWVQVSQSQVHLNSFLVSLQWDMQYHGFTLFVHKCVFHCPILLLSLFPCFSYKNSSFVHFSVCWLAILRTIYNVFYLVDTEYSFMFGIVPQRHHKCRKVDASLQCWSHIW